MFPSCPRRTISVALGSPKVTGTPTAAGLLAMTAAGPVSRAQADQPPEILRV
jgi:hypothetical protein